MSSKTCDKCKRVKPLTEFPLKKRGYRNREYQDICKTCKTTMASMRLPKLGKLKQLTNSLASSKVRDLVEDRKDRSTCQICNLGYNFCKDLHHLDPRVKLYHIGDMSKQKLSKQEVLEELDKCVILCSNCHRIIHRIVEMFYSGQELSREFKKELNAYYNGFMKKADKLKIFEFIEEHVDWRKVS